VSLSLFCEVPRSSSATPHSVRPLWMSDQPVAETSTWQHTTIPRDRQPWTRWDSNPQSLDASNRRTTARPLCSDCQVLPCLIRFVFSVLETVRTENSAKECYRITGSLRGECPWFRLLLQHLERRIDFSVLRMVFKISVWKEVKIQHCYLPFKTYNFILNLMGWGGSRISQQISPCFMTAFCRTIAHFLSFKSVFWALHCVRFS
jgi:hypothetical protein